MHSVRSPIHQNFLRSGEDLNVLVLVGLELEEKLMEERVQTSMVAFFRSIHFRVIGRRDNFIHPHSDTQCREEFFHALRSGFGQDDVRQAIWHVQTIQIFIGA